jgi:hypothetical protein
LFFANLYFLGYPSSRVGARVPSWKLNALRAWVNSWFFLWFRWFLIRVSIWWYDLRHIN